MAEQNPSTRSVAVIGGGMTGVAAALRLAEYGCRVDVIEAAGEIGGLSNSYSWDSVTWDRFYHVVLSTDQALLDFVNEVGLEDELFWKPTRSGFYRDGKLVSMSSIGDFISFPFLSLWQKFRLGLGILTSIGVKNPDKLDRVFVREWLTRVFGRRVYEKLWDPLLRSKLGEARSKTSAAFIWATITRLYGARSGEAKTEQMGHVRGGYHTILEAAVRKLHDSGVTVHTGSRVESVRTEPGEIVIEAAGEFRRYDQALLTIPAPEVLRVLGKSGSDGPYWAALDEVKYLGVICVFVVLSHQVSPYYVTNLLDQTLPFTGIIEVTNIVDPESFGGRHIVYLPKYVTADGPLNKLSDEEIVSRFVTSLKSVHPHVSEDSVLHTRVFRERDVQPLQEVNYLDQTRGIKTPLNGIFIANSTMLYNSTLNNNAAITLARQAVDVMASTTDHAD